MIPSSALQRAIVLNDCVKPIPIKIAPNEIPRNESQFAGPALGSTRFWRFQHLYCPDILSKTYTRDFKYDIPVEH